MEFQTIPTPFYHVDKTLLIKNLEILRSVIEKTDCKILLAQKAFSMFSLYPLIGKYLHGTTASGFYEAKLGFEEMGGETHIFSPAYTECDFNKIVGICDHIIFNSFGQAEKFIGKAIAAGRECGIRINPECSTNKHALYDPCSPGSRLGVTIEHFRPDLLAGISGFHFHTLCEQNADALDETIKVVEKNFGKWLYDMKWINIGGGHHITREDYDIDLLVQCITKLKNKYDVTVYIEPGEAVVLNTGFLTASVIDIVENGIAIAILDTSAACHMPDVLEVPYKPVITNPPTTDLPTSDPSAADKDTHLYRLAGSTCLAGDIIGDYSFDTPLKCGDKVTFCDMAHYSMVKNNTFNGMPLPIIAIKKESGEYCIAKEFGYEDFKFRLS